MALIDGVEWVCVYMYAFWIPDFFSSLVCLFRLRNSRLHFSAFFSVWFLGSFECVCVCAYVCDLLRARCVATVDVFVCISIVWRLNHMWCRTQKNYNFSFVIFFSSVQSIIEWINRKQQQQSQYCNWERVWTQSVCHRCRWIVVFTLKFNWCSSHTNNPHALTQYKNDFMTRIVWLQYTHTHNEYILFYIYRKTHFADSEMFHTQMQWFYFKFSDRQKTKKERPTIHYWLTDWASEWVRVRVCLHVSMCVELKGSKWFVYGSMNA